MRKSDSLLLQLSGLLFFGSLFILAWILFKERMLNFDPAFFSFRIIFEKNYDVELGRWGSVFSQALPLWCLKAGCSLETFLRVYSVSFILIYYLVFLIISLVLKNLQAAIILMLTLCLGFRHSFYYSTAELYQGLAISVLVLALVFPENGFSSKRKMLLSYGISFILVFVLSYYHQILVFPLLFIFIYHLISQKRYTDKYLLGIIAFTVLWFFIRIKFLTETAYEKDKIPEIGTLLGQLGSFTEMPSYKYFIDFAGKYLIPLLILNLVALAGMLYKRKWLLAFFYCLFNLGFIYLNIVTYAKGESPLMYENYLTILGLFCALPVSWLLVGIKRPKIALLLAVIILAINLREIYACRIPFSDRVDYLKRVTTFGRSFQNKKYIVDYRCFPWKYGWVSWSMPFETLLYSSLESPDSAITVCVAEPISQYDSIASWKNIFIGPSWSPVWFWTNELDHNYFNLPDGDYKKITTSQLDSSFSESDFNNRDVTIKTLDSAIVIGREAFGVIPVEIINSSGKRINAISDSKSSLGFCYHLLDENGKLLLWDGLRSYLETDVYENADQGVIFENNLSKGKYILEIDLLSEGIRWWNINTRVKLEVK